MKNPFILFRRSWHFSVLFIASCIFSLTGEQARAEVLNLTTGNQFVPFTDMTLPRGGMVTALIEEAFTATGTKIEIKFLPWKRGYRQTLQGDFVGTFPHVKNEQRLKEMAYSNVVYTTKSIWLVRSEENYDIKTLSDFSGKNLTMCSPFGWSSSPQIESMITAGTLKRQTPKKLSSCFPMLALMMAIVPAWALFIETPLADPAAEARAQRLMAELRCLVCQNQSIRNSNASLARDLRLVVRERIGAGDSDEQAMAYIVKRYGDWVLLNPPFKLSTLGLGSSREPAMAKGRS